MIVKRRSFHFMVSRPNRRVLASTLAQRKTSISLYTCLQSLECTRCRPRYLDILKFLSFLWLRETDTMYLFLSCYLKLKSARVCDVTRQYLFSFLMHKFNPFFFKLIQDSSSLLCIILFHLPPNLCILSTPQL